MISYKQITQTVKDCPLPKTTR